MRTKLLYFLVAVSISIHCTYAQEEIFKVLASKGANKVISSNSHESKPIIIGKKLLSTDKIVLEDNGYLGLAHKSGKTIELKKGGVYEVSKLTGEVGAQNAGIAKKYIDFVASEMASQDEDISKNRHQYMKVTGSVEREIQMPVKLLSPKDNSYVLAAPVFLKWHPAEGADGYVVIITNIADDTVYSSETNKNFMTVDLGKLNLKTEKALLWSVAVKNSDKKSKVVALKYPEDDRKAAALEKEAAEMKSALNEETALNKIILASFYEEKNLLLDAIENYEAAIHLEPEVTDYQVAYGAFLSRHQIEKVKK